MSRTVVHPPFGAVLARKTRALRHRVPTDEHNGGIGSLTPKGQRRTVQQQMDDAVNNGATITAHSQPAGELETGFSHTYCGFRLAALYFPGTFHCR